MYSAYLTVRHPQTGRVLGRKSLLRLVTREAPGLRHRVDVAQHLGGPVLRLREVGAAWFRTEYHETLRVLDACGYVVHSDLTAAAERAVR